MTFYTSNLHFGNEDVARKRHFRDASAMNSRIIDNWNSIITSDDSVYILGGVGEFEFLSSLNGEISIFFTDSERSFYDKYISSVTDDKNDPYNREMFEVYIKNMFYIDRLIYHDSIIKKDYSGSLVRMAIGLDAVKKKDYYIVAGGIGDYQRMFNGGINSDIFVNGLYPLSEVDVQNYRSHQKYLV